MDMILAHAPALLWGAWNTVAIFAATAGISLALAVPLAVIYEFGPRPAALAVATFSWTMRACPTLVLLFFAYYALPALGIFLDPVPSAILALSASGTGYNLTFIAAGLRAVPPEQFAAARALGIPSRRMYRRIVFPQAMRASLPPLMSNLTLMLKGTSLAALVSVPELTAEAYSIVSLTYRPFEILGAAAVLYLILNSLLIAVQRALERRLSPRGSAA
ncbi:amino acid ABC transporter permease [Humitalea sp. 24SJ18S-53]|uniref:amino acid ABC transporter permease n=1 Tax=Humitalea sp. 24SJ18S-53 TaxID=3422307 RepID=UPI003D66866F